MDDREREHTKPDLEREVPLPSDLEETLPGALARFLGVPQPTPQGQEGGR